MKILCNHQSVEPYHGELYVMGELIEDVGGISEKDVYTKLYEFYKDMLRYDRRRDHISEDHEIIIKQTIDKDMLKNAAKYLLHYGYTDPEHRSLVDILKSQFDPDKYWIDDYNGFDDMDWEDAWTEASMELEEESDE